MKSCQLLYLPLFSALFFPSLWDLKLITHPPSHCLCPLESQPSNVSSEVFEVSFELHCFLSPRCIITSPVMDSTSMFLSVFVFHLFPQTTAKFLIRTSFRLPVSAYVCDSCNSGQHDKNKFDNLGHSVTRDAQSVIRRRFSTVCSWIDKFCTSLMRSNWNHIVKQVEAFLSFFGTAMEIEPTLKN